jgi:hypothetical protein
MSARSASLALFLVFAGPEVLAQSTQAVERAIGAALPSGWSIVERKVGEIPWGHHWCDEYKGVTGTELIIRGIKPSKSRFLRGDGQWDDVVVGAEALDVWIMPGEYRESRLDVLCFHRPIQPTAVVEQRDVRIYARPAHHSTKDETDIFNKNLSNAKAVESPESPWNDPERLSWRSWKIDIDVAVSKPGR